MDLSFGNILDHLIKFEIEFIVVGGVAVVLNGYQRNTLDVDVIVPSGERSAELLSKALEDFGEGWGKDITGEDLDERPGALRVYEPTMHTTIDVFTQNGGFTYDDLLEESEVYSRDSRTFRYASKEQLIAIKSSSQRDKDRIDISAMKQLIENPNAFD
ncbi:MAG: nucleotidyltransferase [Verrucomicrobiota bacterium]